MKRKTLIVLLVLLLVGILAFTVFACNNDKPNKPNTDTPGGDGPGPDDENPPEDETYAIVEALPKLVTGLDKVAATVGDIEAGKGAYLGADIGLNFGVTAEGLDVAADLVLSLKVSVFFRVTDGTSAEWTENGKSLNATVELQPGETKELTVVLRWIKNSNNFGLQVNTVTLQKVENPANYEETDLSDNTSIAEVLLSVKTGGIDTSIVIGTALIVMIGALMITIYLKEKNRK